MRPQVLFNRESESLDQNVLVIRIQPDEGISLRMQAKVPGTSFRIESVKMDFHYGTSFGKASPEAYERLLLDAMAAMPRSSRGAMKWSRPGHLSTRSRKPGPQRKARRNCALTRPDLGGPRKPTNCWPGMDGAGGGCEIGPKLGRHWTSNREMSTAAVETFTAGMPVEVGQIERELKKLWDATDGVMTRASLINLAVYSEAPDSLGKNTAIIARLTEDHACRAIVIAADPNAQENRVEAWISAHCHVSRAGSKQVCSEQLSFLLRGEQCGLLPNIVFAHLDSDLPLYLWWQEELRPPIDPQLWAWVDRIIYDSQAWTDFDEQMQLVESAQAEARQRIVLCDLNWVRLVHFRLALAQFFDHPVTHHHLAEIKASTIDHAPGFRSTALLLVGWLAGQLRWERRSDSLGFVRKSDEGEGRIRDRSARKGGRSDQRLPDHD